MQKIFYDRREGPLSSLHEFFYLFEHALDMSLGTNIAPLFEDLALLIEQKRRTNHANIGDAIVFLLANHAKLIAEFAFGIRNERDIELAAFDEFLMARRVVFGDADDLDIEFGKILLQASKILRLKRTAGGIVFWVKIQKGILGLGEMWFEHIHSILKKVATSYHKRSKNTREIYNDANHVSQNKQ